MVDPVRDGAPDYYEYIKKPMALNEIKKKLNADQYSDVEAFKSDVNLIWSNAILYNGEDSLFAYMSKEASLWFDKKMEGFPSTPLEEWFQKVQNTTRNIFEALCNPPTELDPENKFSHIKKGSNK
ncbi:Bromodomain containing protein [Histomonas meleagridis]|uniref:Bromodomain containing protein n=1 Tax=Histomonas meleagridis TaxID=135588 RepID=UPI00355A727F|nr:Bromodomain containing protein [Histomonas meleagridis]KAH0804860.1 Bromodomain containing protein [Histomonas meleagridis]